MEYTGAPAIRIRGARVHNLKNIDLDVPLGRIVGIAGVSGSGKSSLALGVLYAEGSRRYLDALSTYTRRRMTQAEKAKVDEVRYVPSALALHQRPGVPGMRSTFGTSTELLNILRLLFSRLGRHRCPNGHYVEPSMRVAAGLELVCPVCGEVFPAPSAEELSFNSGGACPVCEGTGIVRVVDEASLVPDETKTINEGAVAPWNTLMWTLMKDVCGKMGVRLDVPFKDLTEEEKWMVYHGPAEKVHMLYNNKASNTAGEMDFTYFNAIYTVENALSKVKDEKGMKRVAPFLRQGVCPECGGSRLSAAARAPKVRGIGLDEASRMTLSEITEWVRGIVPGDGRPSEAVSEGAVSEGTVSEGAVSEGTVSEGAVSEGTVSEGAVSEGTVSEQPPGGDEDAADGMRSADSHDRIPPEMVPMAESICESFRTTAQRLLDLGLGYLTLDRESSTLSTGERQRVQLARSVRNRTTGVLYVLDEPSIGLHPANIEGLKGVMRELVAEGNSVVLVDHDVEILKEADYMIEMGPGAGDHGGCVIAQGTVEEVSDMEQSLIGPFLKGNASVRRHIDSEETGDGPANHSWKREGSEGREACRGRADERLFQYGEISMSTGPIHTVKPLEVRIPKGRLTAVSGVSGSGKTTMVLESLIPALKAMSEGEELPAHVENIRADGIRHVKLIDATPIGVNVRSTVATYANIHDELRKIFAGLPEAKKGKWKAGDFSYNTGKLRCPTCDGTGSISLDIQFLPDVEIPCPDCDGVRYAKEAAKIRWIPVGEGETSDAGTASKDETGAEEESGGGAVGAGAAAEGIRKDRKVTGYSLPDLMQMTVEEALEVCRTMKTVPGRLQKLKDLGLGYLLLGEATPTLSGGEAQRLKLASELGKGQSDTVFVFDEPTIGLHPLDVETLLDVFDSLISKGATVLVIEHDRDVIRNADYVIDMGPGGGEEGGRIVAAGTPREIAGCPDSITGIYMS